MFPSQTNLSRLHQHTNKHRLNCTISMSLTNTKADHHKKYLKRRQTLHETPALEALCAKGVFQIQHPISGVNF